MSNVYFIPTEDKADDATVGAAARKLLEHVVRAEKITLEKTIPFKVHFGEQGNRTYLRPANYDALIDFFQERGIENFFIESSVLYGGKRSSRQGHLELAAAHDFTRIPVVIADGEHGEASVEVPIDGNYFQTCSLGAEFARYPQILVVSHFKGHILAGFGGALKQISVGFASKGGKLALHTGKKPYILRFLCKQCGACRTRCRFGAIEFKPKPRIDPAKCIGCGACYSICRHWAISNLSWEALKNLFSRKQIFRRKIMEYALASHTSHRNIYLNFAIRITRGCDCEPHAMSPVVPDIGIFASTDPVAVDSACCDAASRLGRKLKGRDQLDYAEKIGLGSLAYDLITLSPKKQQPIIKI